MRPFDVIDDLKIGKIVEVGGAAIKVEIDQSVDELQKSYRGRIYPVGQIGGMVKIHFGRKILLAYVGSLRMRSEELSEKGVAPPPTQPDQRMLEADLFAEATWSAGEGRLSFKRGVSTYPLPQQHVYLLTREESEEVYRAAEKAREGEFDPLVPIGRYVGADSATCRANIDRLFGLHCAVLGSTGSGKSGTVAAILHALLDHKPKPSSPDKATRPRIVLIDPHGEYAKAFGDRAVTYRAYDPPIQQAGDFIPLSMPYWLMSSDEFRQLVIAKTEHEATSQNNIVYKAIAHARMAEAGLIEEAKDWKSKPAISKHPEEPRAIKPEHEPQIAAFDRDRPRPFKLGEFINHIELEQSIREKGTTYEKNTASELKSHQSILDKLKVLRADPRIQFMMREYDSTNNETLAKVINQLVGENQQGDEKDLRIIDISGLPNEVAGPLTAAIARLLFQYKLHQTPDERRTDPVVLVCEEAHRYVPDRGEAEYAGAQTAVRRIAREGRKYGLGLMLVSQRPSDVDGTVISQCGSWVILRLSNGSDQEHVAKFLPDGLKGMTRLLPSLLQQEALFVGEAAAIPARIRINSLPKDKLPQSENISFAAGWSHPPKSADDINQIAQRMAG